MDFNNQNPTDPNAVTPAPADQSTGVVNPVPSTPVVEAPEAPAFGATPVNPGVIEPMPSAPVAEAPVAPETAPAEPTSAPTDPTVGN